MKNSSRLENVVTINNMTTKQLIKVWAGYPIAFILGGIFAVPMLYLVFEVIPPLTGSFMYLKCAFLYTLGLPIYISMHIVEISFVRDILCGENAHSTFGCWGGTSFLLSIILYGLTFVFLYYLLFIRKRQKNRIKR